MNPILTLLVGQLSERLLVILLLEILERVKPVVEGTSTQVDDVVLDALIAALEREKEVAKATDMMASGDIA